MFPTAVNNQITDSVSQSNVEVVASAPAVSIGSLYQVLSSSLTLAIQNAVANQQNLNSVSDATTSSCVKYLLESKSKS